MPRGAQPRRGLPAFPLADGFHPTGWWARCEVDIICSLAEATLSPELRIPWSDFRADYGNIRRSIARGVPDRAAYAEKVDQPGGFVLPHPPRDRREFETDEERAVFSVSPIEVLHVPAGCYPETNPLVPLEHTAEGSNQPAYKSVIVRLERHEAGRTGVIPSNDADRVLPEARGDEGKQQPQPHQMS